MSEQKSVVETVYFIGCGVLGPDVNHVVKAINLQLQRKMLPGGLHNDPDLLREKLQKAIDEAAADSTCTRIIVGYGLCGTGTVGIAAPKDIPLVFPRVQDCIALFLGSDQAYRDEFAKHPGTFYISSGWYQEKEQYKENQDRKVWLGKEAMGCKELQEKYGKKRGQKIIDFFSTWQQNYQRAAFIDTGSGKAKRYEEYARKMATDYNWKYQRIKGSLALIERLLTTTESDDQILVVPPEHVTIYSGIDNGLSSAVSMDQEFVGSPEPRHISFGAPEKEKIEITYGLGVDAGGTYTDVAIYDFASKKVQSKNKALTTKWDFSIGIEAALAGLDNEILAKVELVSVSTTLATNAIVEGEGQKAGFLLMPGPGGIPDEINSHTPKCVIAGSMSISGIEKESINVGEIRKTAQQMIERDGVSAFAISGYGSIANPAHEQQVKAILEDETGMVVCCGHEYSDLLNFAVRGQTAILNARIIPRMLKFFGELRAMLGKQNITAPLMVVKGDGTLMSSAMAMQRPVETILSGPAASVAGAKLLTGMDNATVVDIGGTTTDTADLVDGLVEVCNKGARVGGFQTHVKALDMRTIGLGGDSQISWEKEKLFLGPRRVGPIVWAASHSSTGVDIALDFIESSVRKGQVRSFSQVILVATEGEISFALTEQEKTLYSLLKERPYSLDEIAQRLGLMSSQFIPTERLEGSGLVQRCSLTPTDLLHVNGSFVKWNPEPAKRLVGVFAKLCRMEEEALVTFLIQKFENNLAEEIFKKQLEKDVDTNEEHTTLSKLLMDSIIFKNNSNYSIDVTLKNPIIGIGAPVDYFLPAAGGKLNAKVIIPKDADVANALGAITSNIVIKKKISIKPGPQGGFIVEGISGAKTFSQIDAAESLAIEHLEKLILNLAKKAGTASERIEMEIVDKVVKTTNGSNLFMGREITATLKGTPALQQREGAHDEELHAVIMC